MFIYTGNIKGCLYKNIHRDHISEAVRKQKSYLCIIYISQIEMCFVKQMYLQSANVVHNPSSVIKKYSNNIYSNK